jgi:ubiquinone/menaquinone biosynthesis C-methylase UbiE
LASDLEKWAKVIQRFLKPNGEFIMVEFHPVIWMFDDDFTKVAYDYQSTEPIVETYEGTYADKDAAITQEYVMWNHALSESISKFNQPKFGD